MTHIKRDSKVWGQNQAQYDLKRRKEWDMPVSDLPALMVSVVGPVMAGSSRAQVLVKGVESDIVREYTLVVITVPLLAASRDFQLAVQAGFLPQIVDACDVLAVKAAPRVMPDAYRVPDSEP